MKPNHREQRNKTNHREQNNKKGNIKTNPRTQIEQQITGGNIQTTSNDTETNKTPETEKYKHWKENKHIPGNI